MLFGVFEKAKCLCTVLAGRPASLNGVFSDAVAVVASTEYGGGMVVVS